MKRKLVYTAFVFLILVKLITAADEIKINSASPTPSALTVSATFPEPRMASCTVCGDESTYCYLYYTGWPAIQEAGYPCVPIITKLFSLPAEKVSFNIRNIQTAKIPVVNYLYNRDTGGGSAPLSASDLKSTSWLKISYQGLFRGLNLFALHFYPVKIDPLTNQVEYIKSITVDISVSTAFKIAPAAVQTIATSEKSFLSRILLNGNSISYKTAGSLAKPNSDRQRFKNGRYKILINEDGLYHIGYDDLVKYDIPVEQFDTRKLTISNRGQEIPIYFKGGEDGIFNSGDYIEFWAEKNKNLNTQKSPDVYNDPFTDINVYWLEIGEKNGLRMVEENGALKNTNPDPLNGGYFTPPYYQETLHFERDVSFVRLGNANVDSAGYLIDHWFFDNGINAVGSRTFKAFLPYPYLPNKFYSSRSVFVTAMMRGLSLWDQRINNYDNHQVEIWLNDEKVGNSGTWMNQEPQVISNVGQQGISQLNIKHGDNDLRIVMDQPGVTDITLLNWFEISYQRQYRAYQNFVKFKQQEVTIQNKPVNLFQFEIDGFTNPNIEVYKPGISKLVDNRVDYITATDNVSSYRLSFQDEIFYPEIEYVILTPDAKKKPLKIVADLPWRADQSEPSLLDPTNSAEYLIITEGSFYENTMQLKSYREQAGLKVEVVRVEDIYDEFNYGIKSPLAIRDFLKYAYENWDQSRPILYVVLIGDASYDYKTISTTQKDLVPTLLFETQKYGATASDNLYALVSGDDQIPDLIIGRVPIRDNVQLNAYMDKIREYENPANRGEWRNRGLFISGNDAGTYEQFTMQPAFRAQNRRLINMNVPAAFISRKLNTIRDQSLPVDPNFGSTTDLINDFDDGLALVNFFGHGGGGIWSDVQLLNNSDIDRLNNQGKYPFITSMTCFTGSFENSSMDAIAEKLLLTPAKGAIGLYASSGLGWLHNDFALGWNLTTFLFTPGITVGEGMLLAEIHYLSNDEYVTENYTTIIPSYASLKYSMVNQYNLLGDPYIFLKPPADDLKLTGNTSTPQAGDTVRMDIRAPFLSGNGRVELANENHELISEQFYNLNAATATVLLPVPVNTADQNLFIKAYAINSGGDRDSRGLYSLTLNKPMVDSVRIRPENPQVGDTVYFSVYITSPLSIDQVRLLNLKGGNGQFYVLDLARNSASLWTSREGFGPYFYADTIEFDIEIRDTNGKIYLSRLHHFAVSDPRPDVEVVKNSIALGGSQGIELQGRIRNNSALDLNQLDLGVFLDSYTGVESPIASQVLDLKSQQILNVAIPIDAALLTPNRRLYLVIDYLKKVTERDENNNLQFTVFNADLYTITYPLGTTKDGVANDTITYQDICRFYVAPHNINSSSVVKFDRNRRTDDLDSKTQPGFSYLPFQAATDSSSVHLDLLNRSAQLLSPAYLEFSLNTGQYAPSFLQNVFICSYSPTLERWVAQNTSLGTGKVYTYTLSGGEFALFHIEDNEVPEIEITVNGRAVYQNMMIPQNPRIALILQDKNGINLSSGFTITVDNNSLPDDRINYPDSIQNANAISILTTPELNTGKHNLTVTARDAKGNTASKSVDFVITGDFQVQIYGNYPNPFEESTIISLQIIAPNILDGFEVKIYTVSGRLIRKITRLEKYPDERWDPGYHEIEWDGRDDDGIKVANGVYFAVVKAKFKGESIEKTLKLAKLR
jgi:hypothetical protein